MRTQLLKREGGERTLAVVFQPGDDPVGGLQEVAKVEALAGGTVLGTRVIPVELDHGAVIFEHKESGPEGSYNTRATVQLNAAGDLVVAYHRSPTSFLSGSSTTEWMRLPRAPE